MPLTTDELQMAQDMIDRKEQGVFQLEDIYGDIWEALESPTSFGRKFKRAVENNALWGVEVEGLTGQFHRKYRILHGKGITREQVVQGED